MKVGDLYAVMGLHDATYKSQLKQIQSLTDQVTRGMSKAMQVNLKEAFKGLPQAANAASKQAAGQIKSNLEGATKGVDFGKGIRGLNFKFDMLGLNSITTGFNAAGIAAGAFGAAVGFAMKGAKDAIASVVSEGMAFTEQMSTVASVAVNELTEISGGTIQYSEQARAAMKALEDQAIDLGASTKFTAVEVGQAQELLARAGFSVNEVLAATPGLLNTAAAEGLGLADTATIAANALRGFGLEAEQMAMVGDLLAATSATSDASIASLGQSFKYIAPIAQTVGLEITEVSAAIGLLANQGIKGTMAGRNLASGLMFLAKPSKDAKALMEDLGITISDSEGNFKSLIDIMGELETATRGKTDADKVAILTTLVGKDNAKSYFSLLNAQYKTVENGKEITLKGAEALRLYNDALNDVEGAAEKMAKLRLDNLSGDMEMLSGAANSLAIRLFKEAEPAFRQFVQGATTALVALTPVFIQVFGTIRSVLSQIISNLMPGLIQAWKNLQPAIAALGPIVMQALGFLSGIAVQAATWGGQIVAQLAAGMAAAIQRVVAVLKYIGSIISYWLSPNSPPKIVPELDKYGTDAAQLYIDSYANADIAGAMGELGNQIRGSLQTVSDDVAAEGEQAGEALVNAVQTGMSNWDTGSFDLFNQLTDEIETSIRALGESGTLAKDAVVPAILESRGAVEEFVESLRQSGTVSEESIDQLLSAIGPVGTEIEGLVRSYADLVEANLELAAANEEVARAQEEVNRITEQYDSILSPLQGKLDSINAEQQRIKDLQRIEKLQEDIASGKLDEHELALAQLEIEEITTRQQIDATEEERDIALDAAEEKLKAAEEAQKIAEENQAAVQAQYDAAKAQIDATRENNSLMQEQVKILQEIAEAQKNAASAAASGGSGGLGGLGGGLGDLGGGDLGLGELEDFDPANLLTGFEEIETAIGDVTTAVSDFTAGFDSAKLFIDGFFGGIPESISPAREAINGFFSTPLGTELQQGAGVIASYFQNDFPRELGEGIGVAQGWLNQIGQSNFGQDLQRGASVVATYMVNEWPGQFQRGFEKFKGFMQPWVTQSNAEFGIFKTNAAALGTYILNDWPEDFRNGVALVSKFFSEFATGLTGQIGLAKKAIEVGFNAIKLYLGSLPEQLKSAGSSIGKALIDGVAGGFDINRLKRKAEELAKSLPQWMRDLLGIKSPSRVMAEQVGLPLVQGIAEGIRQGSPYVITQLTLLNTKILTEVIKLRDDALAAFAELGPLLKEQAEALMNDLDSLEILEGMLPDDDAVVNAAEKFDDIVEALQKNKDRLLDIDRELEEDRKKINAEMLEEQEKSGKKLAELRQEQAELDQQIADVMAGNFKDKRDREDIQAIDKERKKLQDLIKNLEVSGPLNDVNAQRLAELKANDARLAAERQEIIDENLQDLLEDRASVTEEIAETELQTAERLAELRAELAEAESQADAERAEALREQIRLTEELQKARDEFGRQQNLFNQLQQIAELTQQALEQAKKAITPLAEIDPARANKFFNQYQDSINAIYDLEQKLKEEAFGENDPRRIKLLQDQLALLKEASKAEFEALKQQEREAINEEIKKGGELTKRLTDLRKRLGEEEDPERRKELEEEIKAQEEEIRLFNLRLPLLREQLAIIEALQAYELDTSHLPAPGTRLADRLPTIEEILRLIGATDIGVTNPYGGTGPGNTYGGPLPQYYNTYQSNYNLVGNYQMRQSGLSLIDEVRLLQMMRRT